NPRQRTRASGLHSCDEIPAPGTQLRPASAPHAGRDPDAAGRLSGLGESLSPGSGDRRDHFPLPYRSGLTHQPRAATSPFAPRSTNSTGSSRAADPAQTYTAGSTTEQEVS